VSDLVAPGWTIRAVLVEEAPAAGILIVNWPTARAKAEERGTIPSAIDEACAALEKALENRWYLKIRSIAGGPQAMTAGDIYTIAGTGRAGFSGDGGPATSAELNQPGDLAVTAAGSVAVADSYTDRIRMVTG
jgi:hypothetical protein